MAKTSEELRDMSHRVDLKAYSCVGALRAMMPDIEDLPGGSVAKAALAEYVNLSDEYKAALAESDKELHELIDKETTT